jgi:hypothetical protein
MKSLGWPVLTVLLVLAGCATVIQSTHGGSGFRVPGLEIGTSQILVGRVPDGSGDDGIVAGSGDLMTQRIKKELLRGGVNLAASEKTTAEDLLAEGATRNIPFILVGRIPKWENNATDWSEELDYSSVTLEMYRVSDKSLVASSDRSVQGVTVPEDWAGWLAASAVADILGKEQPPWNPGPTAGATERKW